MFGDRILNPGPGEYNSAAEFGSAVQNGHIGEMRGGYLQHAVGLRLHNPGPGDYVGLQANAGPKRRDFRDSAIAPFATSGRGGLFLNDGTRSAKILHKASRDSGFVPIYSRCGRSDMLEHMKSDQWKRAERLAHG